LEGKFGLLRSRQIELRGAGELGPRLVLLARIDQRLAPFEVQPAPVGRGDNYTFEL
jgi:hypothetical protein